MPSIDETLLCDLHDSGKQLIVAEQNNGYIWQNLLKVLWRRGKTVNPDRIRAINTLDSEGRAQFIHSGTYEELVSAFELSGELIARRILKIL